MKIRSDFVSNSSSTSFIITTKESQDYLFNYIVNGAYDGKPDEYGYIHEWNVQYDKNNREFLETNFNKYIQLVIGDFKLVGYSHAEFLEDEEEDVRKHVFFSNVVVKKDDIDKFVKDGKVLISYDDFRNCSEIDSLGYKVVEITQDSIDFTRWLMTKCVTLDNPNWKALNDFLNNELTEDQKLNITAWPQDLLNKYDSLLEKCKGFLELPIVLKNVKTIKDDGSEDWMSEVTPLSELLDEYEKRLKDGNRIYRVCFGTSGEGQDWSSFVWFDSKKFLNGNDKIKFEYDVWW